MSVIVHVKVVDNTVVAQRPFPLVQPSRPLRFTSCSPLIWCSTSRCAGPAVSSKAVCEKTVEIPQLHHVEKIAAWTLLLHARCVQRQMPGGSECNNTPQQQHHNNNNNTIWGGSVLTGEEPPPHSGELKHALPQAGGPTQSQLSRPVSSGHHISMVHGLRRKQLNSDTNASNRTYLKEKQEKRKEETFFFRKNEQGK